MTYVALKGTQYCTINRWVVGFLSKPNLVLFVATRNRAFVDELQKQLFASDRFFYYSI